MVCPHCEGAEDVFSGKYVRDELESYRKKGPRRTTRIMLDALKQGGVEGLTLLDIGGGVGTIAHELFAAGLSHATDVDASTAYIQAAQSEAEKRGHADRLTFAHGDFVQLAPDLEAADIVTLDRVVCCYPDMEALVTLSAQRAKRWYALIYPRDNWLFRAVIPIFNALAFAWHGNPFRTYIHPTKQVDARIRSEGFSPVLHRKTWLWQVFVYRR